MAKQTAAGAISVALAEIGVKTKKAQADALGEREQHWGQFVLGRGNPSEAKIVRWVEACTHVNRKLRLSYSVEFGWVARWTQPC
jgi:hypothetical protein